MASNIGYKFRNLDDCNWDKIKSLFSKDDSYWIAGNRTNHCGFSVTLNNPEHLTKIIIG